jgi:hypothetical protein
LIAQVQHQSAQRSNFEASVRQIISIGYSGALSDACLKTEIYLLQVTRNGIEKCRLNLQTFLQHRTTSDVLQGGCDVVVLQQIPVSCILQTKEAYITRACKKARFSKSRIA